MSLILEGNKLKMENIYPAEDQNREIKKRKHVTGKHVIFYKKLRSGAGRQFLKFSGQLAIKRFLHVS